MNDSNQNSRKENLKLAFYAILMMTGALGIYLLFNWLFN